VQARINHERLRCLRTPKAEGFVTKKRPREATPTTMESHHAAAVAFAKTVPRFTVDASHGTAAMGLVAPCA
jgi:hypothetical protein